MYLHFKPKHRQEKKRNSGSVVISAEENKRKKEEQAERDRKKAEQDKKDQEDAEFEKYLKEREERELKRLTKRFESLRYYIQEDGTVPIWGMKEINPYFERNEPPRNHNHRVDIN
jgi:Skp family chaperone for outer membrane proteins